MPKQIKHLAVAFVGGCPKTKCGIYTTNDDVTAYIEYVTCKSCRR